MSNSWSRTSVRYVTLFHRGFLLYIFAVAKNWYWRLYYKMLRIEVLGFTSIGLPLLSSFCFICLCKLTCKILNSDSNGSVPNFYHLCAAVFQWFCLQIVMVITDNKNQRILIHLICCCKLTPKNSQQWFGTQ